MESQSVISDPQAIFRWFNVPESLEVTFPGFHEAIQSVQNAKGSRLVDRPELSLRLSKPNNLSSHL
jgi:hypothetical protein